MVNIAGLAERMGRLRFFKGLSPGDITAIIRAGHIRSFAEGEVIVTEDMPCAGMFVLLSGMVHLYRMSPDGQAVLIDELTPVTMFNEIAILDGGPNLMTVIAARPSRVWHADYSALLALSERYPQVALGFLPIVAKRTRVLVAMVTDICFRSVRARTAKLLLDLSDQGRQPISRQDHPIQKMAAQISTAPEAVSRTLRYLRDEGVVCPSRTTIVICDPDRLAELAQLDSLPERGCH